MEIDAATRPFELLDLWIREAQAIPTIPEPTAMILSTADASGHVHGRTVLCKSWSEAGLTFFTNYNSPKAMDLSDNPHAAVTFYWGPLARQVNIHGAVEKTSRQVSEDYWNTRHRGSQLSQHISRQSRPVENRERLEQEWAEAERHFQGRQIPCPEHWGGYRIQPVHMEFWVGRQGRLHDRHLFEKIENHWTFTRLYP